LIQRSGAFYSVGDQKVQGKEKLYNLLKEDTKLREELEKQIQTKIKQIRLGKEEIPEEVSAEKEVENE
jgi:hypothetical protein